MALGSSHSLIGGGLRRAFKKYKKRTTPSPQIVQYVINNVKISIVEGDILTLKEDYDIRVDALVNPANSNVLRVQGGLSGKILKQQPNRLKMLLLLLK